MKTKLKIKVYTDGSINTVKNVDGIDNVAAYGFIAMTRDQSTGIDDELGRAVTVVENSTITEMELRGILSAAIFATKKFGAKHELTIEVYSDSKTATDAFNDYISKWIKASIRTKGEWRSTNGKPVAHQDIYKEILEKTESIKIKYIHVKSHKDSEYNNAVDKLVRDAVAARIAELIPE
jgi:ribonuclease HI